jgi:hypothetical protein
MKEARFLYTDGRDVVVTPAVLQVKGSDYKLTGITTYGVALLRPSVLPGLLITLFGLAMVAENLFHYIPSSWYDAVGVSPASSYSTGWIVIGIAATVIGLIYLALARRRYAVQIETAEGKKIVVKSRSKQYVDQILMALRRAKTISRNDYQSEIN